MQSALAPETVPAASDTTRSRKLQLLGILSGFTAGAWLGAAEAPTKLVSIGISPIVISLIMVIGVFLARWSLPALVLGTASIRADVRRAPHLLISAVLAGRLWAVANTLTFFAIRYVGRRAGDVLWSGLTRYGVVNAGERGTFSARRLGRVRRRSPLGHHVHPLPQSLLDRDESAFFRHLLHLRRIGHDGGSRGQLYGPGSALAGIAERTRRYFLADARRLHLGDRRCVPAIRGQVRGNQPGHPAF